MYKNVVKPKNEPINGVNCNGKLGVEVSKKFTNKMMVIRKEVFMRNMVIERRSKFFKKILKKERCQKRPFL